MDHSKSHFLKWGLFIESLIPDRNHTNARMVMKRLVYLPLCVPVVLLTVCVFRAAILRTMKDEPMCREDEWDIVNRSEALRRFTTSIAFQTISLSADEINTDEILRLHEYLIKSFPLIHNCSFIDRQIVNNYSLLYHVRGSNPQLKPYILTAHLDVVPVNLDTWTVEPFNATTQNGYIYGRGTIDDKHNVMGIVEALECLLKMEYQPQRSFFIAFGHDEEVGGEKGAQEITKVLKEKNVDIEFVLDEGLVVMDRMLPGLIRPLALIGVTEKGYLTVKLSVQGTSGHSSMPPSETAIGILARALHKLETKPQPVMFGKGPESEMFDIVAPYACFGYRLAYANVWLLSPIMAWIMSYKPTQNALIRTTTAITVIHGGVKENVIPSNAYALVNHRIHPAQTVQDVVAHDLHVINDKRVKVDIITAHEPHPVSDHDHASIGYQVIKQSIHQIFHNAVVAPGVLTGNTDSRWYIQLTPNIYRFSPSFLTADDVARFHGDDERILVENYFQVISFYVHLIKNIDQYKVVTPRNSEL